MVSETQRKEIGEGMIAAGFVLVTFSLPFVPFNVGSIVPSSLEVQTTFILAVSGITGFLIFVTGVELWKRNREHWKDV